MTTAYLPTRLIRKPAVSTFAILKGAMVSGTMTDRQSPSEVRD